MAEFHVLVAGITAIILFLYGLESFSKEIERISGDRFRNFLADMTKRPIVGMIIGAIVTGLIQSSSATSVIAVSLVNAGVLSFKNSVGIIFGANIGTTVTAQLIALKLTDFAPVFIITGFLLSLIHSRYSLFSKTIFYFGFVFFSLNLVSSSLSPLQNNEYLVGFLNQPHAPWISILAGCVFTAIIQSSSVTTGLAIIFTQQGLLGLENAIPLIMGANIGTAATALIASVNMDASARKTALSHLLFNVGGVMLFFPAFLLYEKLFPLPETDPEITLANVHLVFNVLTSMVFLLFINPFVKVIEKMVGEGKMDFERINIPNIEETDNFESIGNNLFSMERKLFEFISENYNLVTLSLETNYNNITEVANKRLEYVRFLKSGIIRYFSVLVSRIDDEEQSREVVKIFNQFDYLFQIHDSTEDLLETKQILQQRYVELKSDTLSLTREISSNTLIFFEAIRQALEKEVKPDLSQYAANLQQQLNQCNKHLLKIIADEGRADAGPILNFMTYSQRIKDKLVNYQTLVSAT